VRAWVVGTLLLAVVAVMLGLRSGGPQQAISASEIAPAVARPIGSEGHQATSFEVFHARDLAAALSRYAAQAPPRDVRRLRTEVDAACRVLALLEQDGRNPPDSRRDAARRELQKRCADLPVPSLYVPVGDTRMPPEELSDPVAAAAALAQLHGAMQPEVLVDAWLEAFRLDALPQHRIFPDQRRLLPAEAEALIRVVADWRECTRLNACGPGSLFALRVCALNGCEAGSDVQSAWHQALSPRDYESVLAIHAWLTNWQAGPMQ